MFLLEKPQGRLHPRQAELLLSGRSCDDRAGKEVRRLLLCKRAALCRCCLLSGAGRLAAGHQNQPGTERRCGKWVSGKNCCADTRSCPGLRCRKCILQLRGVRPFLSDKYDLTQHPNYKYTADYDKKLTFDIEKYLDTRAKLHPKDEFFVIEEDAE